MQGSVITLEILKEVFSDVPHTFEIEESMVSFASPRLTHKYPQKAVASFADGRKVTGYKQKKLMPCLLSKLKQLKSPFQSSMPNTSNERQLKTSQVLTFNQKQVGFDRPGERNPELKTVVVDRKMGKCLTQESSEIAVHAFITSKLDYCNSLLYGCRKVQLKKLQYVQNTAARIVTQTCKFDHIAPVLFDLHWFLVSYRIVFKTLLLVFK